MIQCVDSIRVLHPLFQAEDGGSIPTSALQLNIVSISSERAVKLNRLWHSRMPQLDCYNICSPCYGAEFHNILYAIAMWSLPIAANRIRNGSQCLELRRMAISEDAPRMTASRMLSVMAKLIRKTRPDIFKLISYQDIEVHKGTIYKAAGWHVEHNAEYTSWGIHTKRPGRIEQSQSPKVRWAYILHEPMNNTKPDIKEIRQSVMELGL